MNKIEKVMFQSFQQYWNKKYFERLRIQSCWKWIKRNWKCDSRIEEIERIELWWCDAWRTINKKWNLFWELGNFLIKMKFVMKFGNSGWIEKRLRKVWQRLRKDWGCLSITLVCWHLFGIIIHLWYSICRFMGIGGVNIGKDIMIGWLILPCIQFQGWIEQMYSISRDMRYYGYWINLLNSFCIIHTNCIFQSPKLSIQIVSI